MVSSLASVATKRTTHGHEDTSTGSWILASASLGQLPHPPAWGGGEAALGGRKSLGVARTRVQKMPPLQAGKRPRATHSAEPQFPHLYNGDRASHGAV